MVFEMPGVTICPNHAGFLRSVMGASEFMLRSSFDAQYQSEQEILRSCFHNTGPNLMPNGSAFGSLVAGRSLPRVVEELVMAKFGDIFLECRIGYDLVDCEQLFFMRLNLDSQCFTFNYNGSISRGPTSFLWTYTHRYKVPSTLTAFSIFSVTFVNRLPAPQNEGGRSGYRSEHSLGRWSAGVLLLRLPTCAGLPGAGARGQSAAQRHGRLRPRLARLSDPDRGSGDPARQAKSGGHRSLRPQASPPLFPKAALLQGELHHRVSGAAHLEGLASD